MIETMTQAALNDLSHPDDEVQDLWRAYVLPIVLAFVASAMLISDSWTLFPEYAQYARAMNLPDAAFFDGAARFINMVGPFVLLAVVGGIGLLLTTIKTHLHLRVIYRLPYIGAIVQSYVTWRVLKPFAESAMLGIRASEICNTIADALPRGVIDDRIRERLRMIGTPAIAQGFTFVEAFKRMELFDEPTLWQVEDALNCGTYEPLVKSAEVARRRFVRMAKSLAWSLSWVFGATAVAVYIVGNETLQYLLHYSTLAH